MPSFPLSLPASPKPREITWKPISLVSVASSPFTGKEQVYAHPGQWWEISFELPPLSEAEAAEWAAMLLRLNGREGSFNFQPTDATPRAAVSGSITVDFISDNYLDITGMTGTFSPGDWIQIGSGLYRITTGATAVTGDATIEIWPTPRADVAIGSAIEYAAPQGRFRLFDSFEWEMDVARNYGIALGAKEVL